MGNPVAVPLLQCNIPLTFIVHCNIFRLSPDRKRQGDHQQHGAIGSRERNDNG
jgi:hypothetical protein